MAETRLGTAEGRERHWIYVCPECGTHTLDAHRPCEGPGDPHDPTPFERVRIMDAKDYDEQDERLARAEAENTTLRERGDAVADSINRWFAAEDWPGGEPEAGERRLDARDGLRQAQANWRKATGEDRDGPE